MSAPMWILDMLGWKPATQKSTARCIDLFGEPFAPNLADVGGLESLRIAGEVYRRLGVTRQSSTTLRDESNGESEANAGTELERCIEQDIRSGLESKDPTRRWLVKRTGDVSEYVQFKHLRDLQAIFDKQPALRVALGRDYHVKTDVCVGVHHPSNPIADPFLHAAISCKWTIRSDRVQNVRHEFATLVRNRRGRLPHLVLVTAEPLPSRLISIARGTGEVDTVYHLLHDELDEAVKSVATADQRDQWTEMIEQRRLRPYSTLSSELIIS